MLSELFQSLEKRTVAAKGLPEIQKMAQFSENLAGNLID